MSTATRSWRRMGTLELHARIDQIEQMLEDGMAATEAEHDALCEEAEAIQDEIDGRRDWNSSDPRIREAAGNFSEAYEVEGLEPWWAQP